MGVFRRMLFQRVLRDVRSLLVDQAAPAASSQDGTHVCWRALLKTVCDKALQESCVDSLVKVAMAFGVALVSEVEENATSLAEAAGLKPLEWKRVLHAYAEVTWR